MKRWSGEAPRKVRSGTAAAALGRKAGPMRHRLEPRGGATNEVADLLADVCPFHPETCDRENHEKVACDEHADYWTNEMNPRWHDVYDEE